MEVVKHADCHVERQLAEGSPGKGHVVDGPGEAGRAFAAGNEAGGRRCACHDVQGRRL